MKKEPDPNPQTPEEAAVEERVRRMMDIAVPDGTEPVASSAAPTLIKISEDSKDSESPQPEPAFDEELETIDTAPALEDDPKPSAKKSITITHFTDEHAIPTATSGSEPEPTGKSIKILPNDDDTLPEPVDNPLIPTDKLVSTIDIEPPAEELSSEAPVETKKAEKVSVTKTKTKTKAAKTKATPKPPEAIPEVVDEAEPSEDVPMFDTVDDEIAHAFDLEQESVSTSDEPATAPELPGELLEASEATEATEQKPKRDKFTPLTDIRPRMPASETQQGPLKLDDEVINDAVEDILISDADQLLSQPVRLDHTPKPEKTEAAATKPAKTSHKLHKPQPKLLLKLLVIFVLAATAAVLALPQARVTAFNTIGVRATLVTTIQDQSTGLPLKDVTVTVSGKTAQTDANGKVSLGGLRFGKTEARVERQAYSPAIVQADLKLLTNTLPEVKLAPTGTPYAVTVTDFISGKPVKATADSSAGNALANDGGTITLRIDKSQTTPFEVTISASGYRPETVTLDPAKANQPLAVSLVLSRKYAFLSRQSGTYDVYVSDLDGRDEKLVLKGTGNEQPKTTALVSDPNSDVVALISTRTNTKAADGILPSTLTVINLKDGTSTTITEAAQLQLISWQGDYLIYTQIAAGSKSTDADRQQLVSYSFKAKKSQVLAKANYFNNVLVAAGKLFYAPSSAYQQANNIGLFQINPDGTGKVTLLLLEAWNVYRTSYDHLSLSVQQDWYDFKLGDSSAVKQSAAPAVLDNKLYIESPDGQHAAWVNATGPTPRLAVYNIKTGKETAREPEAGLSYPLRWLNNDILLYRITTAQGSADYAYSLSGNTSKKLHDVANIAGFGPWQVK